MASIREKTYCLRDSDLGWHKLLHMPTSAMHSLLQSRDSLSMKDCQIPVKKRIGLARNLC